MKTRDALAIGHALGRIERTLDAWEESKHKRAANGQFTSGGGGGGAAAKEPSSSGEMHGSEWQKNVNKKKKDIKRNIERLQGEIAASKQGADYLRRNSPHKKDEIAKQESFAKKHQGKIKELEKELDNWANWKFD